MRTVALLLLLLMPLSAQTKAADFKVWWKQFQATVARRDTTAVISSAKFPMQWENGATREVKAASDFAARFDFYFTPEIKKVIATRTPVVGGQQEYTITWKARGNEYSLYFKDLGQGWALDGLSEGPP